MTDQLPYTYTDDGAELTVTDMEISVYEESEPRASRVNIPQGADAVALARAILAAAGNTGHEVVSEHQMEWRLRNAGTNCARSMRDRAIQAISDAWGTERTATEMIRALPLLPNGDTTGPAPGPCLVTAWNDDAQNNMVCAYDAGHLSPHYNPREGGWTWDDNGNNLTELT